MIEKYIYRVQDHWMNNYLISPVTGQLLKGATNSEWESLLSSNSWERVSCTGILINNSNVCRCPPDYDLIQTDRGFSGEVSAFGRIWIAMVRLWLTPANISTRLGKTKIRGGGLELAIEIINRLGSIPKNQCFIKSFREAVILRQCGVPFSLIYGVIAPSNLVHAWVEIPTDDRRATLLDEYPGMVYSYQASIEIRSEN